MLELSNEGSDTAAVTSSASTQPSASASPRLAGGSGEIAARIAAWYASTVVSDPSAIPSHRRGASRHGSSSRYLRSHGMNSLARSGRSDANITMVRR